MKTSPISGAFWIFLAAATSSIGGMCFLSIPLPTLATNSLRCAMAAGLSFIFLKWDQIPFKINFSTLLGGLCFALTTQFFSLAVPLAGAGISTLLLNTSPLFILFFQFLFFKKVPSWLQGLCCLFAFSGIWLIVQNHTAIKSLWGIAFGLASGACYSGIFFAAQGKNAQPASAFLIGQILGAFCGSIFLINAPLHNLTLSGVGFLLLLGFVQLGLSYRCMAKGLPTASPLTASLICSIEPVLAAIWASIFAKEAITIPFILGSSLVIAGIVLQQLAPFYSQKTKQSLSA